MLLSMMMMFGALGLVPLYYQHVRGEGPLAAGAGNLALTRLDQHTAYPVVALAQGVTGLGVGAVLASVMVTSMVGLAHAEIPRATTTGGVR